MSKTSVFSSPIMMLVKSILPVIASYSGLTSSFAEASSDLPTALDSEGCRLPLTSNAPCAYLDRVGLRSWTKQANFGDVKIALVSSGLDFQVSSLNSAVFVNSGEKGEGKESDGIDNDGNGYVDDSKGWDSLGRSSIPWDGYTGLGTFSASVLAAKESFNSTKINNNLIEGVATFVKLLPIKIMSDSGVTNPKLVAAGLRYAASRKVNLVLLEAVFESADRDEICAALEELNQMQVLVIAPAGNTGRMLQERALPASCETANLLVVGSSNELGNLTKFSSFHPTWVHLVAPGEGIFGMTSAGFGLARTGTNGSAALVAGAAAHILTHFGFSKSAEIKQFLLQRTQSMNSLQGKVLSGGELRLPSPAYR